MIELLPFERGDINRLLGWVDSRELLLRWAGPFFSYPLTAEQCQHYLATSMAEPPQRLIFKAVSGDSGEVVGHIELDAFDGENQSAFICRVLVGSRRQRGRGLGRSIVNKAVDLAFSSLPLHRLAVGVMDFNQEAIRCYEKCGFQYEGRYRDVVKYEERFYSVVTMSLLREEWLALRKL